MRHLDRWRPTKIERIKGKLRVRSGGVGPGSLLMALAMTESLLPCLAALRGRIVDLGAGRVPFYEAYAPSIEEVICVDWQNSLHELTHADLLADLGRPLPFETSSFDGVLLSSVLEHVPDPAAVLKEVSQILRPGGAVVLEIPFLYWLHEEPHDFGRYTEHALRRFALSAGLEVEKLDAYGGIGMIIGDVSAKGLHFFTLRAREWLPGRPGALLARLIDRINRWAQRCLFNCLTFSFRQSRTPRSARKFPLGYVAVMRKPKSAGVEELIE